jgi:LuxR family transcriptional activator of conjugal transfer of Ti plasmids
MRLSLMFEKLIDACEVAADHRALKSALSRVVRSGGFDYFAYLHIGTAQSLVLSDYPDEWQSRYLDRCYVEVDPVVAKGRDMQAFDWSGERCRGLLTTIQRSFFAEAADFGIRSGISVPVRAGFGHCAMFTLASGNPDGRFRFNNETAVAAAAMIHLLLNRRSDVTSKAIALSIREATCLRWIAEGKKMEDIAVVEGIKYGTVRDYLDGAKEKLNVSTLAHATAVATRLALI